MTPSIRLAQTPGITDEGVGPDAPSWAGPTPGLLKGGVGSDARSWPGPTPGILKGGVGLDAPLRAGSDA